MDGVEEKIKDILQYSIRQSPTDYLSDIPDNVYKFEKGKILVSRLVNGYIPFKRHFKEFPSVSVWLTFKPHIVDNENFINRYTPNIIIQENKSPYSPPSPSSASMSPPFSATTPTRSSSFLSPPLSPSSPSSPSSLSSSSSSSSVSSSVSPRSWVAYVPRNVRTLSESNEANVNSIKNVNNNIINNNNNNNNNSNNNSNNSSNSNSSNNNNSNDTKNSTSNNNEIDAASEKTIEDIKIPIITNKNKGPDYNEIIYYFKLKPAAVTLEPEGIRIRDSQIYQFNSTATIHYIAYNKTKPVDPSFGHIAGVMMMGGIDAEKQVHEWVENGNNINITDKDDQSLLHIACQCSYTEIAKWLVEKGIKTETRDKNGWTPLLCAINEKNLSLAKFLIENGGLTKPIITTTRSTILHYLVRIIPKHEDTALYIDIIEEVIKIYPDKIICQGNVLNENPFHKAAASGNLLALVWFLDPNRPFYFDPNAEDKYGGTVLHHAVRSGQAMVVEYLVQHPRIDVPSRDSFDSPFKLAVSSPNSSLSLCFPFFGKIRLKDLTVDVLLKIFGFLNLPSIFMCSLVSKNFLQLISAASNLSVQKTKFKFALWSAIEKTEYLLQQDLAFVRGKTFQEDWNSFAGSQTLPAQRHAGVIVLVAGARQSGASVFTSVSMCDNSPHTSMAAKVVGYAGQACSMQVLDKPEAHSFVEHISPHWLRRSHMMLIMYPMEDYVDADFSRTMNGYLQTFDKYAQSGCQLMVVATKADLVPNERQIRDDMLLELKKLCVCPVIYKNRAGYDPNELRWPYVHCVRRDNPQGILEVVQLAFYLVMKARLSKIEREGDNRLSVSPSSSSSSHSSSSSYSSSIPVLYSPVQKKSNLVDSFKNMFK